MKKTISFKPVFQEALQRGFGLIELMITIVIVSIMSIAVFNVLSSSEGQKRTITTTNDVNQTGNYAIYQLDKIVRQAGSGFSSGAYTALGCELYANLTSSSHASAPILPFPSGTSMAAPFTSMAGSSNLGGVFRLAPVVIASGATTPGVSASSSDALIVMAGTAGWSEYYTWVSAASATSVTLNTSTAFNKGDLVLLIPDATSANTCAIEEVSPTTTMATGALTLGDAAAPTYYANPIGTGGFDMTTAGLWKGTTSMAMSIGNAISTAPNLPSFQLIGVGDNNVLYSYDLLQGGAFAGGAFNSSIPITDSVFEMHALYGLYDGTWVKPTSAAGYDYLTLENGSPQSTKLLQGITQIRIGLILRSALQEKAPPTGQSAATPGPINLFTDLGSSVSFSRTLSSTEQNFRYRTVEATIPIRNMIMARP